MMFFTEDDFQSEERAGFRISSLMKRCWAAQLEVLQVFDRICRKYNLRYYLAYGTLLGTVRHGGFIPWDDDIDVLMLGEDLDRLVQLPKHVFFVEGLELVSPFTDPNYKNLAFRLINTRNYCTERTFLDKYWQFPFMAGIDIFPLNYLPRKSEDLETLRILMTSANVLGQVWNNSGVSIEEKKEVYYQLTSLLGVAPVEDTLIENHLWKLTDRIGAMYTDTDADMVANLPWFFEFSTKKYPKEWFGEPVFLEFEGIRLPCPTNYLDVVKVDYGENFMTPKQIQGAHQYPYYRRYYENMRNDFAEQGLKWPEIYREL